jgi:hypothetical protein
MVALSSIALGVVVRLGHKMLRSKSLMKVRSIPLFACKSICNIFASSEFSSSLARTLFQGRTEAERAHNASPFSGCNLYVTVIGQPPLTDICLAADNKKKGVLTRPKGETTGRTVGRREGN